MKILIDDVRDSFEVDNTINVICRTASVAQAILLAFKSDLEIVYWDHDLGDPNWDGAKLLKWAIRNDVAGKEVVLITGNPAGRDNMEALLKAAWYEKKDGIWIKPNEGDWHIGKGR